MPEQESQNWTLNTLREHFMMVIDTMKAAQEQRFADMWAAQEQRHVSSQEAIHLAFSALLVPDKVVGCPCQDFGIVFYLANQEVTVLAQKSANTSSNMAMIDAQKLDVSGPLIPNSFRSIAEGTYPVLACQHLIILRYSQVELRAELVLSPLLSVPDVLVFLPWVRFVIVFAIFLAANPTLASDTKTTPRVAILGKVRKGPCFKATSALLCLIWHRYLLFVPPVLREAHLTSGLLFIVVLSVSSKVSERLYFEAENTLFLRWLHKVECALGEALRYTDIHDRTNLSVIGSGYRKYRGASSCFDASIIPQSRSTGKFRAFFEVEGKKR